MTWKLTWRNLWRNKRRTIITMASISFAVVLAIVIKSLQEGVFNNLIKNVVSFYSGYIQVHKRGYQDEQVLENSFVLSDSLLKKIQQPSVKEIVPRIESFALASTGNTTKGCMVVGTDPEKENQLTSLKSKLKAGAYFNKNENVALIAEGLARRLYLTVNDTIVLLGQGYQGAIAAGKYAIKGIVKFGQPQLNDGLVYLPLATAQKFLSAENIVTSVALAIDDPENLDIIQQSVASGLDNEYEVMTWKQMMPDIENHMKADAAGFYVWTGILYLIIAFGIFGTILMMTAERKYEFGMLIAIGMKKIKLGKMLIAETVLISICGTLTGILISVPVVLYLQKKPIHFTGDRARAYENFGFEAIFPATFNGDIFLSQAFIVLIIAMLIGIYPLWNVSRLNPVAAMRK
ncbi:ABC transporter permease [Panacibacter ginsenosidivorans]|uniref:ABC transporter permease n=1 Tax=Panacibacter ginsenosidivorans TaxID=1813871 RepID=A0A5B8VCK3_9BACT|nr:ABC transporter permease [Panacibacter ginsenosidivorans]QEC69184.1 ABC transporter permease [Panacibacter ginsenosidivorans]